MSSPRPLACTPALFGPLTLRNRVIKTATYEGMTPGGRVSPQLIAYHGELARRGVALTTVAYGAVSADGRTFGEQLLIDEANLSGLAALTEAVHRAGGAACLQLAHAGGFSKHRGISGRAPRGPSLGLNAYGLAHGLPLIRKMSDDDLARTLDAYGYAAALARRAGFDALELHCGHGYLLSQFLSPRDNRRRDRYGGSRWRRLRFPLAVARRVRAVAGSELALAAKINLADGVRRGLGLDEAKAVARALTEVGVDAIIPSGGMVQRSAFYLLRGDVPLRAMARVERDSLQRWALRLFGPLFVRPWRYGSGFFFDEAASLLDSLRAAGHEVPVALLGGVDSASLIDRALARGFGFVALGRALLADPDLVERLCAGEDVVSRCDHCNQCVATMDEGGVRCTLDERGEA
ncbi:MAG: NADH:flavin oxidoreductase [Proteobacteria bacterium]|nr:MAG: NADH:flavin oxidoreductase [Pseudomonadota bacterium]